MRQWLRNQVWSPMMIPVLLSPDSAVGWAVVFPICKKRNDSKGYHPRLPVVKDRVTGTEAWSRRAQLICSQCHLHSPSEHHRAQTAPSPAVWPRSVPLVSWQHHLSLQFLKHLLSHSELILPWPRNRTDHSLAPAQEQPSENPVPQVPCCHDEWLINSNRCRNIDSNNNGALPSSLGEWDAGLHFLLWKSLLEQGWF